MDSIFRAAGIYILLLVVFRLAGNRAMAQMTAFDLILLLIISETVQQAMITEDYSMTNAMLLVVTLVAMDIVMSLWKHRSERLEKLIDGVPILIMADGKLYPERMKKERVDESDILAAAREIHGLERLDQVKYAVIEASGGLSIIPKER